MNPTAVLGIGLAAELKAIVRQHIVIRVI